MCHGFFGIGYGDFRMFGIMNMAGSIILQLVVFALIVVAAVCAIRWFVKNIGKEDK